MQSPVEVYLQSERQWKRHVRIKFAQHGLRTNPENASHWLAILNSLGVRANGSIIPSDTTRLERSLLNDQRAKSAKVTVAEVSKE